MVPVVERSGFGDGLWEQVTAIPGFLQELRDNTKAHKRGISNEQVCIVVAVDTEKQIIAKPVSVGRLETTDAQKLLGGRFSNGTKLVTDSHGAYNANAAHDTYGFVTAVKLINEVEEAKCAADNNYDIWCEYVFEPVLQGGTLSDQIDKLYPEYHVYRITDDTKYVGIDSVEDLKGAIDEGKGIWVTATRYGDWDVAKVVYVGEKLSTDATISAVKVDGVAATLNTATWTANVSYAELVDTTDKWLEITAAGDVVVKVNGSEWTEMDKTNDDNRVWAGLPKVTWDVTVTAEDGVTTKTYTIDAVCAAAPTTISTVAIKTAKNSYNAGDLIGEVKVTTNGITIAYNWVDVTDHCDDAISATTNVKAAHQYALNVTSITADAGYVLADNFTVTINGTTVTPVAGVYSATVSAT